MPKGKKPKNNPATQFPSEAEALHRQDDWLWIPLRSEWRDVAAKPEEIVRQSFIRHLVDHYGYSLAQMDQERRVMHGHRSPRADIVIWETPDAKAKNQAPVLVIECKAEGVDINIKDYYQGESYTRAVGCEFFIAHNTRFTAVFRLVPGLPGEFVQINEIAKASDWGDAKRIEEIKNKLRAFNRKEFQDLLFKCHSILRDVHKMEPGRAFDTMSKVLFIKMYVERSGLHGTFTVDYLDRRAKVRLPTDLPVHDGLFEQTKNYYKTDDLFSAGDRLEISEETFRRLVKELERFDLSKTGDDIKGLAFETLSWKYVSWRTWPILHTAPYRRFHGECAQSERGSAHLRSRCRLWRVSHSRLRACPRANQRSDPGREGRGPSPNRGKGTRSG
jgi:type I restriction enzyme M protein